MKINTRELYKHIGDYVKISKKQETEYMPKGTYLVAENSNDIMLFNMDTKEAVILEELHKVKLILESDPIAKLDNLIDYHVRLIIQLSNEGFVFLEKDDRGMDISPYLEKLENLSAALNTLLDASENE